MSAESQKSYDDDPRTSCKYGQKCYQKSYKHLSKFKHPPKTEDSLSPPAKKLKVNSIEEKDASVDEKQESGNNSEEISNSSTVEQVESQPLSDDEGDPDIIPASPGNLKEKLREKFLVDMPQDFFDFWEFCSSLNSFKPEDALSKVDLLLCGPYDVLSSKSVCLKGASLSKYLCHWRFYHDPPEFQTVLVGNKDDYHIGYFRDDPCESPAFLGSMSSARVGSITQLGNNVFAAIYQYLNTEMKTVDTFKKCHFQKMLKDIEAFAKDKDYSLESKTADMKERNKRCVTKSFHGAGICVPINKETDVGYREIPETNANLKKILRRITEAPNEEKKKDYYKDLQELLTNVQFANDEGDFGMGLELGIDLLVFGGKEFHSAIQHLLTVSYDLLGRGPFAQIIQAHLKDRLKGPNMSRFY